MKKTPQTLITVIMINMIFISLALGATDKKIISGTICQSQEPEDRANLGYYARGILAKDKDIKVVCPIVRDSTQSRINFVGVRYQRGFEAQDPKWNGAFKGSVLSCSDSAPGTSSCQEKDSESPLSNDPTSVHVETRSLPHDDSRYFVYKSILPEGTVLKSITYQEED